MCAVKRLLPCYGNPTLSTAADSGETPPLQSCTTAPFVMPPMAPKSMTSVWNGCWQDATLSGQHGDDGDYGGDALVENVGDDARLR